MKLLKPPWVNHDEKPIFSIDVHPDGEKFATGGQSNDCGRVVIWNMAPLISEAKEHDTTVPKLLCQMENHSGCVNCVRWSMNGEMLASGGDDKLVMIWKRIKGTGGGVFGSGGLTKNAENWRCVSTLRGHAGDVLDLAWSPQDRWLASCSVDNNIIIWDVPAMPRIVAILKGHDGLVKGVAWDPVGKFVASQSDDKSVRIWKTSDWTCQSCITDPFDECGGTTHILRLSWSPDGQYLVSAHAMNGGGPTAQIIEREGWKHDKDFVGHRKAVTCVRFHNSIMKRQAPKTNKSQQYCCLAIGSRDRSLSVWMTALQRPLVVINDLFEASILDISWSGDGCILMACSSDGTIACLQFTTDELGKPLSEDDKNALYQRMYGKSAKIDMNSSSEKDMIVEYSDLLNDSNDKLRPPVLMTTDNVEQTVPSIPVEIKPQSNQPASQTPVDSSQVSSSTVHISSPAKAIHKQIETRTADGKRRITPMFIPINQENGELLPIEMSSSSRTSSNIVTESSELKVMPKQDAATDLGSNGCSSTNTNDATKEFQNKLDNRLTKTVPPITAKVPSLAMDSSKDEQSQSQKVEPIVRLQTHPAGKAIPFANGLMKSAGDLRVQIINSNVNTPFGPLCKAAGSLATAADKKLWEIFIGSPVVNFSVCAKYTVLCSLDATVRFLDIKTGISILPVINLPTAAVQSAFSANSSLVGVLSECGLVRIWNIEERVAIISTMCTDILRGGQTTSMLNITESGIPFILLSNGSSYSYCKKLESWLVLNSRDPVLRHGLSSISAPSVPKNIKVFPLLSAQVTNHTFQPSTRNFLDVSDNVWQNAAKLSFIENQLRLCEAIDSPEELKYWYSMLGYHLAGHGTETRVRLLLDDLLGHVYGPEESQKILGVDKQYLLETVLNHLKTKSQWQRIYMEYFEQLSELKSVANL